jgi:hypothetical protein
MQLSKVEEKSPLGDAASFVGNALGLKKEFVNLERFAA